MSILQDTVVLMAGAERGSGALPSWRWPKPELIWRPPTQLGRHTSTSMRSAGELTRTELGARNGVARAAERGTTIEESQAEAEAHADRPRQSARGHRCNGGISRLARRPQITGQPTTSKVGWCRADILFVVPASSRHPRESGGPGKRSRPAALGSRFRGNDEFRFEPGTWLGVRPLRRCSQ